MSARTFSPKRRTLLLSLASAITASLILTVRKLVQYAAAPAGEKESDFVFPPSVDQTRPTRLTTRPAPAGLRLVQRGGFINGASHSNRTAVYGLVKVRRGHKVGDPKKKGVGRSRGRARAAVGVVSD